MKGGNRHFDGAQCESKRRFRRNREMFLGFFGVLGFLGILLAGCTQEKNHQDIASLLGPSTATGTISATGSSLHRRGTHLLLVEGRNRLFLESKSINLSVYENQRVKLEGEITPNTHPSFLPVMQVATVTPVAESRSPGLQRYNVSILSLSLEAPREWLSQVANGRLTFRHPDDAQPFIAVEESGGMPEEGIPIRIHGRNGVRVVDEESGVHRAYVKLLGGAVVLFTFGPKGPASMGLRDAFYTMLRSVQFEEESDEPEEAGEVRDVGSGRPCGGPAGVLCPEGEYCKVTEFESGIGTCKSL